MQLFELKEDRESGYTGTVNAAHKWSLPGVECAHCGATWSGGSKAYPSVDLSPIAHLADFETARAEPLEEYERLRELVRPLLPPGAVVHPGSAFGPLVGRAQGHFGPLISPYPWWLLVQREALEKLQAAGVRGLKGCGLEVRFRQRQPPALLELELLPMGRLHPDCLPPYSTPPCQRCGRDGRPLPDSPVLKASTLPSHLDVFRLEDYSTVILCTERFVEACQRLGLDGVRFHPLAAR